MIMSIILMTTFMTTLFDKANIDITRRNLILITLRAKGLKSIFKVKSENQKSKVDYELGCIYMRLGRTRVTFLPV